jgi:tetratricopeptide (TPR) repeat protein
MDPDNPIVKLCAEGIAAEFQHRFDDARRLFTEAWEASSDDYEACIAAHYLARRQESPEEALRWNLEAMNRADAVGDSRVDGLYPSLLLNMGYSHEALGNLAEASRYYDLASERIDILPADGYGDLVRSGIEAGRKRIAESK